VWLGNLSTGLKAYQAAEKVRQQKKTVIWFIWFSRLFGLFGERN
jgi:hypothetical protein